MTRAIQATRFISLSSARSIIACYDAARAWLRGKNWSANLILGPLRHNSAEAAADVVLHAMQRESVLKVFRRHDENTKELL